jgi:hypothetical protein
MAKSRLVRIAITTNNIKLYTFVTEYDLKTIPHDSDVTVYLAKKWNSMSPNEQHEFNRPPVLPLSKVPNCIPGKYYTRVSFSQIHVGHSADTPADGGPILSFVNASEEQACANPFIHFKCE